MSSKLRTAVVVNDSNVVDGNTADAAIWNIAYTNTEDELRAGRVSVSDADTHVKNLEDAVKGVAGQFAVTKQNVGANEELQLNLDATGVPNGYNPTANGAGGWAWAAAGGGGAAPVDVTGTAGENLALRDYVYLDEASDTWFKVDTDATPVKCGRFRGIVNVGAISATASGSIRMIGEVAGFSSLTPGLPVYASTTLGDITQTKPSPVLAGSQVGIVEIGIAVSATNVLVYPSRGIPVQYMIRASLANNATLTLQHHSDAMGHNRRPYAYTGSSEAGSTLAEYASSNQDNNVALSDRTIATYTADQCTGGTASADSVLEVASNAFDNNNSSRWTSANTAPPHWIEYDFGVAKTIRRYTIRTRADSTTDRAPANFELQYFNGSTWVAVDSRTGETAWTLGEQRTYNVSVAASANRWRIYITANNGSATYTNIAEVEMMEVSTYTDGATKLAQTFNLPSLSTIAEVNLWLKKVGTPVGTVTVRIETLSGSDPSGTLVDPNATATFAESSLGTSYANKQITFASPFSLAAGDYAIVVSTSRSVDELNYIHWGADASSPGYAGGNMRTFAGSWAAAGKDAIFSVVAQGTTFNEPAVCGRWSGGTRDVAVRYDDGLGADGNTKTTCKNVTGVTQDVTLVVEIR
jgi:hypothetical protein